MTKHEEQLQRQSRWYVRNKEQHNRSTRLRYFNLRTDALIAYGGACECCNERHTEFLCIDHKNGGGNQERKTVSARRLLNKLKQEGYPKDKYRCLCHNCNFAIGLLGYCPHSNLKESAGADPR